MTQSAPPAAPAPPPPRPPAAPPRPDMTTQPRTPPHPIDLAPLRLMHGNYFLSLSIHSWDHAEQFHRREDWWPFAVRNPTGALGMIQLDSRWS